MRITLNRLTVMAHIGVGDAERKTKQPLYVTVSFNYNADQAKLSDDIRHAIDYAIIRRLIITTLTKAPLCLLEHAVWNLKTALAAHGGDTISAIAIQIDKPEAFSDVDYVSVAL